MVERAKRTGNFGDFLHAHAFMKTDLQISIKAYRFGKLRV